MDSIIWWLSKQNPNPNFRYDSVVQILPAVRQRKPQSRGQITTMQHRRVVHSFMFHYPVPGCLAGLGCCSEFANCCRLFQPRLPRPILLQGVSECSQIVCKLFQRAKSRLLFGFWRRHPLSSWGPAQLQHEPQPLGLAS